MSLIKYYVEQHLVPAGNTEEIVHLINRLHSLSDMGASVYVYSCAWCVVEGEVQEDSYQRLVLEGLKIYPDNLVIVHYVLIMTIQSKVGYSVFDLDPFQLVCTLII